MYDNTGNRRLAIAASAFAIFCISSAAVSSETDFGYDCIDCPAAWQSIDTGDRVNNCGGPDQSPIALSTGDGKRRNVSRLRVDYGRSIHFEEEELSTNYEWFDLTQSNSIRIGKTRYDFVQFHFHSAAEHVVNGERTPLEMHFVNQAANGALAVLAVFVEEGSYNRDFEPIVESINNGFEGDQISVDLRDLPPRTLRSFRYVGSTTTPPCVADVQWILLKEPIELSSRQIEAIQDEIRHLNGGFDNNRTVQNREYRTILADARHFGRDDDDDDDDEDDD